MASEKVDNFLSDVYEFRSGLSKSGSEFGSGYPFLTFKDVFYNLFVPDELGDLVNSTDAERIACDIRRGDVFLTRTSETMDELGMSCVALRDVPFATFNGFSKRLRPKPGSNIVPEYAGYFFRGPQFRRDVTAMSSLSTRASLNNDMLSRLRISLPSMEVQAAIGNALKNLDDKVAHNRRITRLLDYFARAIFRAWFVDFEPVKIKAAGGNSFPSMPPSVFDALSTRLIDSEFGPVPEGWEAKPLNQVAHLTMGQSPSSEFYNLDGDGLPFHQGVSDYGFRFPTHRVYCTTDGRLAEPRDILLSVRAPVGRINVADRRLVLGRGLAGLRHRNAHQTFLFYQLAHVFAEEDAIGDGTIFKSVTKQFLSNMPFLVPTENIEKAFEDLVRPFDELVATKEAETCNLLILRDYLLPRLLNGNVRVEAAHG
ncbi:restriction endonuclease subunit S [Paraburkholderia sp. SOS3]|uniref:restriction endonuclease subunit S n=1 Tax=Paraburkholderia sp. SOS3 TaxID=1926494 RepID=UPI0009478550|nr:restriction endonuclease subunit S [Paraburkholderia sp. SOS3]APR34332.1 hypothetical protein BTO02_01715 [Paraburkholderia sp. SOS3]